MSIEGIVLFYIITFVSTITAYIVNIIQLIHSVQIQDVTEILIHAIGLSGPTALITIWF